MRRACNKPRVDKIAVYIKNYLNGNGMIVLCNPENKPGQCQLVSTHDGHYMVSVKWLPSPSIAAPTVKRCCPRSCESGSCQPEPLGSGFKWHPEGQMVRGFNIFNLTEQMENWWKIDGQLGIIINTDWNHQPGNHQIAQCLPSWYPMSCHRPAPLLPSLQINPRWRQKSEYLFSYIFMTKVQQSKVKHNQH